MLLENKKMIALSALNISSTTNLEKIFANLFLLIAFAGPTDHYKIIGFVENLLIVHCKQCCITNSITWLKHYSDYTKLRTLSIQRTLGYISTFISSETAWNIVLNWEFQLVVLLSYCWLSLWLFALAVFKTALKFSVAGIFKLL